MENFIIVVLILCLLACLIYIYWLHSGHLYGLTKTDKKRIDKYKKQEPEEDEITFLKSEYDASVTTKTEDDIFDEENE